MLLAGGQGSRLHALTSHVAKPAVPFGGKYRIIDFPLSNCINSGIDTVGVLTQYRPLELNAYIGNGEPWDLDRSYGGVHILPPYMREGEKGTWYKGTANAIYQNINFLETYDPEYVLILSGDHVYKMDYTQLLRRHKEANAACTIAVLEVPMEEASRFGIMNVDENDDIYEFEEKPKHPKSNLASMGIYIFTWSKLREYLIADEADEKSSNDFGKNITPATLVADITSDYEWIYANYEGFEGDKDLNYIHASNQYQDFAAKLRFMYGNLGDYFDHAVSYPWVGYLFTGMTPDEVQKLAAASHQYWADYGRYAEETWTSPVELPGKTGIVSIDFITGLTFTDELKDLYATLQTNGIDVYIVSASPIDTVLAANETMGYNLPEDHVYAMRNKLGEDGRYINEYNYDWGGEGKYAQTQGEGKSTIITNFIAPQYDNAGPLMVFGDSSGDWNMMTDWMESGDTELGVIFNRYRKPGSDPIWQGSNEAAQSIGDPDARFVLQGRDENTGELRPSEKSILLGETDEVLVRPAE